jgi:putative membrane protein
MMCAVDSFATTLAPLADTFDGHHDWGDGWWIVMAIGMLAFWALVIVGAIWLVRELAANRRSGAHPRADPGALEILDRRLAEGAISIEEYRERRRALTDAKEEGGG